MPNTTDIDGLSAAIAEELSKYTRDVAENVRKAVKEVAKETVSDLKETSPKRTGNYGRGWTSTVDEDSNFNVRIIVHNKKYGFLTHLLENGHAKVNGGRVRAYPHIKPAEQEAAKKLEQRIKAVING